MEKFILLGASRGLGWETYNILSRRNENRQFLLASRKVETRRDELQKDTFTIAQDFSKPGVNEEFYSRLLDFNPDYLIYFAGGGPYGFYHEKSWSSHQWCLQTSFLYPAELVHRILGEAERWANLKKIVLIGSAVAEDKADPMAASYAAAKHALRGLVDSINLEQSPRPNLQLFSPPYMQTDLLPANSHPRLDDRAENPVIVAERLIEYIEKT